MSTGFCGSFWYVSHKAKKNPSDIFRMAVAGSIAYTVQEVFFHFLDTVNVRAKASRKHWGTLPLMNRIWQNEGCYGFFKGFSAMFYGSVVSGFIYFGLYKYLKQKWLE